MIVRSCMPGSAAIETYSAIEIEVAAVDFVRDHEEVVLLRKLGDAFEIALEQHAAGRIVRRVDHHRFRLVGHARGELVEVHAPVALFVQRNARDVGLQVARADAYAG